METNEKKESLKENFERRKLIFSQSGITKDKFDFVNEHFNKWRSVLCKNGSSFELFHTGSITKVVFADGKKRKYGDLTQTPGMHLPTITNRNVKKRLESGEYTPQNKDSYRYNSNTIFYCSKKIKENLWEPCVAVDIVGAYWQSAVNLGVIDHATYLKGIEKDREYKNARNIAIGSLGSLTMYEKYVDGKLVQHKLIRKFGACARLDIVDHVWEVAQKIAAKLGPDFLLFLTDCFFVPLRRESDVKKYLAAVGYKTKSEAVIFTELERMRSGINKFSENFFTERVHWKCLDKNQYKYHDFSNKHNYDFQ
jgi:hypothetical protein